MLVDPGAGPTSLRLPVADAWLRPQSRLVQDQQPDPFGLSAVKGLWPIAPARQRAKQGVNCLDEARIFVGEVWFAAHPVTSLRRSLERLSRATRVASYDLLEISFSTSGTFHSVGLLGDSV